MNSSHAPERGGIKTYSLPQQHSAHYRPEEEEEEQKSKQRFCFICVASDVMYS